MSEYDPKVLAEAEARVQELVIELERIQSASSQLESAKGQLDGATEHLGEVGKTVRELSEAVSVVVDQLRKLKPDEIRMQLDSLEASAGEGASERRALRRTASMTLVTSILTLVGTLLVVWWVSLH